MAVRRLLARSMNQESCTASASGGLVNLFSRGPSMGNGFQKPIGILTSLNHGSTQFRGIGQRLLRGSIGLRWMETAFGTCTSAIRIAELLRGIQTTTITAFRHHTPQNGLATGANQRQCGLDTRRRNDRPSNCIHLRRCNVCIFNHWSCRRALHLRKGNA